MSRNRAMMVEAVETCRPRRLSSGGWLALALVSTVMLGGCKPHNQYASPPPPAVSVATPVRRDVTTYLEETGQVAAVKSVGIVARVQGYLEGMGYEDGAVVEKGANLFTIQPAPYKASLDEAEANLAAAKAKALFATQQNQRFSTLASKDFASQMEAQRYAADYDAAQAAVLQAEAAVEQATITYSYTHVAAPFDGVVTAHMQDVGALVGTGQTAQLANLIQIDPVWVNFNISEADVIRAKTRMAEHGIKAADLHGVPIDVALQGQAGYPYHGHLDYTAPQIDAGSGTLAVRGVFANPGHALLPGNFVRLRLPIGEVKDALLVPDAALGEDQGGHTLLVVDGSDTVVQRSVTVGEKDGSLRVVASGLQPTDRVIVDGLQRANVGDKVVPHAVPIAGPEVADRSGEKAP